MQCVKQIEALLGLAARGCALRAYTYGLISAAIDLLAARHYQIYQQMVDRVLYSPASFSLNFAQSSGTQSIRSVMPYFCARLVIWSTRPPVRSKSASSAKYFSKPAGEMSSSNLAGFVVAFQNVCGMPLGLDT
jgi:hypothetical protein